MFSVPVLLHEYNWGLPHSQYPLTTRGSCHLYTGTVPSYNKHVHFPSNAQTRSIVLSVDWSSQKDCSGCDRLLNGTTPFLKWPVPILFSDGGCRVYYFFIEIRNCQFGKSCIRCRRIYFFRLSRCHFQGHPFVTFSGFGSIDSLAVLWNSHRVFPYSFSAVN